MEMSYEHKGLVLNRLSKQAAYWLERAAEQGDADAQYYLSDLYEYGKGVELDEKKAMGLCLKAAEQGHADAQYSAGHNYHAGNLVEVDFNKAVYW